MKLPQPGESLFGKRSGEASRGMHDDRKDEKDKKDETQGDASSEPVNTGCQMNLPQPGESLFGKRSAFDSILKAAPETIPTGSQTVKSIDMREERLRVEQDHDEQLAELKRDFEVKRSEQIKQMELELTKELEERRQNLEHKMF